MTDLERAALRLTEIGRVASAGLVEREVVVQLILLAAVAREHLLLVGPPGTAKSEAVRRVATGLGGRYFEYLVGRFTEPSEIFGAVDLRKLRDGLVETQTEGMLPEADVAFIDEVFLGSTAILNTLLGVLNERVFRRGHTMLRCPLRVCVGASNRLPEDPSLAAFSDRFLLHAFLEPVPDPLLEALLDVGWSQRPVGAPEISALPDLDRLIDAGLQVDVTAVRSRLAEAVRVLRSAGILLSDRRVVKAQRLVAAAAVLDGRDRASEADLWPLVFAISQVAEQDRARDLLRNLLESSRNAGLGAAAEQASFGPLARAARLERSGVALLDAPPAADPPSERRSWRLKLEGVMREIDAGFLADSLPRGLAELRPRLAAAIDATPLEPSQGGA